MFIIILFYSCSEKEKKYLDLENCINEYFNIKDYGGEIIKKTIEIDYYGLMQKVEEIYLEEKFLEDNSQKNYKSLIKRNNKHVYTRVVKLFEENEFAFFVGVDEILINCPLKTMGNLKNKFRLKRIDQLMASGYKNDSLMMQLIDETNDFDNIIYRSSIIYISTIRLFMNNNPDVN